MSLTHCPDCRRLCFVDSAFCPSCEVTFRPGTLAAAAAAEEKSFMRAGSVLFLAPFLGTLLVLFIVLLRA